MKAILLLVFKVLLVLLALALIAGLVYGMIFVLMWPWWVGLIVLFGLVGIVCGLLFLRKLWLRRREQQFVDKIINQDEARLRNLKQTEREQSKDLQDRWKEAIQALRSSHLKRLGNPLYVLPWYLVIGESGSGKTTAITSARLSSPFTEVSRTSGIAGTKNCDWWFFEQAVIIDTAGRYAIPIDEGQDKKEWQRFLGLLMKYRKKEALNGLVVTIAADKLLRAESAELENDAVSIRRRIDELMLALGTRFPVYVMVTKCDLIQGFSQLCEHLPEESLNQAMGYAAVDRSVEVSQFLQSAIDAIGERLRELRLLLLHKVGGSRMNEPGLILFPEEFENLKKGLSAFLNVAFRANPYQETPIFRGLFFSSGRQEGSPFSRFLNAMGLIEQADVLPGTNKGLFLHDFFSKILPADRSLFAPTQRAARWRSLTTNLGLISWLTLGVFVCGLLTYSFVYNSRSMTGFSARREATETRPADLVAGEIPVLFKLQHSILGLHERNEKWWPARLGLTQSEQLERELKRHFCMQFKDRILTPGDQAMAQAIKALGAGAAPTIPLIHVTHILGRLALLNDRVQGKSFKILRQKGPEGTADAVAVLGKLPEPRYWAGITAISDEKQRAGVRKTLASLYVHYLAWSDDQKGIELERRSLMASLETILTLRGANLFWLVSWVNQYSSLPAVTLEQFWLGTGASEGASIAPAYTLKGKAIIDDFIHQMEPVLAGVEGFKEIKARFYQQYRIDYLNQWQRFTEVFPNGANRLKTRDQVRTTVVNVGNGQGPYLSLLHRMMEEIPEQHNGVAPPGWLQLLRRIQQLERQINPPPPKEQPKTAAEVVQQGQQQLETLKDKLTPWKTPEQLDPATLAAVDDYRQYQAAIARLGALPVSQRSAYQMVGKTFREDPALGESPFVRAVQAVTRMKNRLGGTNRSGILVWQLLESPIGFSWKFALNETACQLQEKWDEMVLAEASAATGWDREKMILGEGGLAWTFVNQIAAPFISRTAATGYRPTRAFGGTVPFDQGFFSFLNHGSKGKATFSSADQYHVTIEGKPTGTNEKARLRPRLTRLRLQCGKDIQELVNYHFRVARTFTWSPGSCDDVSLEIELGDTILRKQYQGKQAFVQFLRDFPGGHHTFSSNDFPHQKQALVRYNTQYIRVNYLFQGHQQILGKSSTVPNRVPEKIVRCWE